MSDSTQALVFNPMATEVSCGNPVSMNEIVEIVKLAETAQALDHRDRGATFSQEGH